MVMAGGPEGRLGSAAGSGTPGGPGSYAAALEVLAETADVCVEACESVGATCVEEACTTWILERAAADVVARRFAHEED